MKLLDLRTYAFGKSDEIDDEEAAMLLECLSNVKRLRLNSWRVSFEMQTELYERGREEGCEVNCDLT